LLALITDIDW